MGRINADDMEKYSSSTDSEWLKLEDDGDIERVQFLYEKYEDLDTFAVHQVETGECYQNGNPKTRMVDCKRDYDDPLDMCPLCQAGYKVQPAMILSMYSHNDGKIKIWQRGKTFKKIIESKFNRYPNLSDMVFEIERHGKKGDNKTTYELIAMPEVEPYDVSEIEKPEFIGGVILDWTPDELQTFVDTGVFPQNNNSNSGNSETTTRRRSVEEPVRRRDSEPSRASRRRV